MRLLFDMDTKDYDSHGRTFLRPSARCITIRDGKVAMVYSQKYNYYKFPGGGIIEGESGEAAMIRETKEEAGLVVLPYSIRPFGYVHRVQKSDLPGYERFVQENYYYLCQVEDAVSGQSLCDYEAEEGFTLVWMAPDEAIFVNRCADHGPKDQLMLEREARVLELLKAEEYFGSFPLGQMLQMQNILQEKYKHIWEPICPAAGKHKLLWLVGELGEVIDLVKKKSDRDLTQDGEHRKALVEELADVLMYYNDVLNCYGITEAELKQAYVKKFHRNMERW